MSLFWGLLPSAAICPVAVGYFLLLNDSWTIRPWLQILLALLSSPLSLLVNAAADEVDVGVQEAGDRDAPGGVHHLQALQPDVDVPGDLNDPAADDQDVLLPQTLRGVDLRVFYEIHKQGDLLTKYGSVSRAGRCRACRLECSITQNGRLWEGFGKFLAFGNKILREPRRKRLRAGGRQKTPPPEDRRGRLLMALFVLDRNRFQVVYAVKPRLALRREVMADKNQGQLRIAQEAFFHNPGIFFVQGAGAFVH